MSNRIEEHSVHEQDQDHHALRPFSASAPPAVPVAQGPFNDQLPEYVLVRPDITEHTASGTVTIKGPIVPLIPADQLPPWLEIAGVPRELNLEQMKGLKNLGEIPKVLDYYDAYLLQVEDIDGVSDEQTTLTLEAEQQQPCSIRQSVSGGSVDAHHNSNESTRQITNNDNKKLVAYPKEKKKKKHRSRKSHNSERDDTSSESTEGNDMSSGSSMGDRTVSDRTVSLSPSFDAPAARITSTQTTAYRLRPYEGIRLSRHAVTTTNSKERTQTVPTPLVSGHATSLNPHGPSPPPSGAQDPTSTHVSRFRGGPIPPPDHPAARMLKTFTPAGTYSPSSSAQPSTRSMMTASRSSSSNNNNNTIKYTIDNNSSPSSSSYQHQLRPTNHNNGSSGTSFCRHWCHHNMCKWQAACKYKHEMPQTPEGLREVGLVDWPMWYKAQRNGLAMGMDIVLRGAAIGDGNYQHHPAGFRGGVPSLLALSAALPRTMEGIGGGGAVMSPKEIADLRERLERQELEEKRAKLARDRLAGGPPSSYSSSSNNKIKSNKKKDKSSKDAFAAHRLRPRTTAGGGGGCGGGSYSSSAQDDDYIADESLEAAFRRAELEDKEAAALQMRLQQANTKAREKAKGQEQGNLLDL